MRNPLRLEKAANAFVDSILGLPENEKNAELRRLKQHHPLLHDVVKERLRELKETY